mgnify:CR=1 FL=1
MQIWKKVFLKNKRNIKIVILGDCYVGKTSILKRYVENKYNNDYKYTIAINFLVKTVVINNIKNSVYLWDTAGSERFRTINSLFYRSTDACIVVFDLTKIKTFSNINYWMDEFLLNTSPVDAENFPFVLLGNKSDLTNDYDVSDRMIEKLCKERNIKYFSVSAKTSENLEEAINYIIEKAIDRINNNINNYDHDFDKISLSSENNNNDKEDIINNRCYCF